MQAQVGGNRMEAVQLFLEAILLADEDQLNVERAGRLHCAVDDGAGRPVPPHSIEGNPNHPFFFSALTGTTCRPRY